MSDDFREAWHAAVEMCREKQARIEQLEARLDRAVTRGLEQVEQIATLEAALREYESDYCEGWCTDAPPQAMFDCGGCRARAALAPEQDK